MGKLEKVFLSLGSNLGARRGKILQALSLLDRVRGTRLVSVSGLYESESVGAPGPAYLNAAALVETRLSPLGLLVELKRIEACLGRRSAPRWSPRTLDLDILLWGSRRMRTRLLEIPHPRLLERRFMLEPLAELGPRPARAETSSQGLRRLGALRFDGPGSKC